MPLLRIPMNRLPLGKPLPFDVYSSDGRILRRAGSTIRDSGVYQDLLRRGYVHETDAGEATTAESAGKRAELLATTETLIADDSDLFVDMLEKNLRYLGLQAIRRANNGQHAISIAQCYRPQLVFLDIDMPGVDGLSTLQVLQTFPQPPFVCMLSAHSSIHNVRKAVANGAAAFVVKPYQVGRLEYIVEQFLQRIETVVAPPASEGKD